MARVNLKKLKEALNKIEEKELEAFYLTHDMVTEDPKPELGLIYIDDEENWDNCMKLYNSDKFKVLKEFANAVWEDAKKAMICIIDEDKTEDYADDVE